MQPAEGSILWSNFYGYVQQNSSPEKSWLCRTHYDRVPITQAFNLLAEVRVLY
jgi:hypothetical protein